MANPKKLVGWKNEAERVTAAIVETGNIEKGAEILEAFGQKALADSKPIVSVAVAVTGGPNGDSEGVRQGDGLIELHVPAGNGAMFTLVEKLREAMSFIGGSTIDLRGGAQVLILTRSKPAVDE